MRANFFSFGPSGIVVAARRDFEMGAIVVTRSRLFVYEYEQCRH
jgi:hypothetical protein